MTKINFTRYVCLLRHCKYFSHDSPKKKYFHRESSSSHTQIQI